jgi:hypothetical protein
MVSQDFAICIPYTGMVKSSLQIEQVQPDVLPSEEVFCA